MSLHVYNVPQDEIKIIISRILEMDICSMANDVMQKLFKGLEMKFNFTLTEMGELQNEV